jgi:hypothetical protein
VITLRALSRKPGATVASTEYGYRFVAQPTDYGIPLGFAYQYASKVYNVDGSIDTVASAGWTVVPAGGPVTITGKLKPFQSVIWILK